MRAFRKALVLLVIISLTVPGLTACSAQDKLELLNALEKTALISTFESQSQVIFEKVEMHTNLDEFTVMEPTISILNGMSVIADQKSYQNQEKTITQAEVYMKVDSEAFSEETTVWSYADFTGAKPVIRQIVKVPSLFSGFLPEELSGKPYMVMDQSDLVEADQMTQAEYNEVVESVYNMQSKIINELKEYALEHDIGIIAVRQLDDQWLNGKKHTAYQLQLDDASLKVIIKSALLEISDNEQAKELIKEFFITTMGMTAGYEGGFDLEQAYFKLVDGSSGFEEDVDRVAGLMDNVKMLGSQGIVINFLIDEAGYIVGQNGVFDLYMDSQQVENALERLSGETPDPGEYLKMTFGLKVIFNSLVSNINGAVAIDYPELTEENSFDVNDMLGISAMNTMLNVGTAKLPKALSSSEAFIKAEVFPVKIGDTVMLPLKPVCELAGADYKALKTGGFSITAGSYKILGIKNSADITVNQKAEQLDWPVIYMENHYFVPEQLAEKYLDIKVSITPGNKLLVLKK